MAQFTKADALRIASVVQAVEGTDLVKAPGGKARARIGEARIQFYRAPATAITKATIASGKITPTVRSLEKFARGTGADAAKWVPSGDSFDCEHVSTTEDVPTGATLIIVCVVEGIRTIIGWACP